jgi:outer membrane receptor for monomeric catechols
MAALFCLQGPPFGACARAGGWRKAGRAIRPHNSGCCHHINEPCIARRRFSRQRQLTRWGYHDFSIPPRGRAVSFVCLAGHGWRSLAAGIAHADTGASMGADAAPGGGLETITVTARKTKENLQDTPISITAITGTGLEQRGITQIDKIQDFTPNLTFQNVPSNSGVASNAAIYIRGIGQNDFAPSVDPGVGIYVDGIYMGRSVGGVFDAIDLAAWKCCAARRARCLAATPSAAR